MDNNEQKDIVMKNYLILALQATTLLVASPAFAHGETIKHSLEGAQVYPESVVIDQNSGRYFVGSVKDGTIYTGQVGSPATQVFSPAGAGGREIANGLNLADGKLIVVARQTGQVFVYDAATGEELSQMSVMGFGNEKVFLNDVTFVPGGDAFVTDSINPVLYRVIAGADGKSYSIEPFMSFEGTAIQYKNEKGAAGINLNGIVASADGKYLIVSKRNEGALFRIDVATKDVTKIEVPAGILETQDGMFLDGNTLYAAQNLPKNVAVLDLSDDFTSATLNRTVADGSFAFPTSVQKYKESLLVVSSQFDTKGSPAAVSGDTPPQLPFYVTEVPAGS